MIVLMMILVCLTCGTSGRRTQVLSERLTSIPLGEISKLPSWSARQSDPKGTADPVNLFASLLLGVSPAAAFNPSLPGSHLLARTPTLVASRPVGSLSTIPFGLQFLVMNAADDEEEEWEEQDLWDPEVWTENEWWEDALSCVEYEEAETGTLRLGVYQKSNMMVREPHIQPLCASSDEEGVSALFVDEDMPTVPLSAARRVLDSDYIEVSMRQQGGGQGWGNPHGEHGEDVYDLTEVEFSPGVAVTVRDGRDMQRSG